VLNSERISRISPRTMLAPFGSNESTAVTTYMITLEIVRLVNPRPAYGRDIGGAVISIVGMVSTRLAALDMAMITFSRCSGILCLRLVRSGLNVRREAEVCLRVR
jgi:hypothetical protein